jgi:hypothetical protein
MKNKKFTKLILRYALLLLGFALNTAAWAQYCTPSFIPYAFSCVGGNITNVTFAGFTKLTTCTAGTGYYRDFTTTLAPIAVTPGLSYPISISQGGSGLLGGCAVWIDYNKNGVFESSERILTGRDNGATIRYRDTITIPVNVTPGLTVMRVMGHEDHTPAASEACTSGDYYGEAQDFAILITDYPRNNASVTKLVAPIAFCPDSQDVKVRIANRGKNRINSVNVEWTLNGVPQPTVFFTDMLDSLGGNFPNDTVVTLGRLLFTSGVPESIRVWTSNPNAVADTTNSDDTLKVVLKSSLRGHFTIGPAGNYGSFSAAVAHMNEVGVCGKVVFEVTAGSVYTEKPIVLINTGNFTDSIVFMKTGIGANPLIVSSGVSFNDAAIDLKGVRNVIFDGIDITATTGTIAYGYRITNTTLRGSSNNTIKNCKVILNRTNNITIGLVQTSSTVFGGGINATSSIMGNHNNTYKNIKVENSYNGIMLIAAPSFPDTNCIVTSEGGDTTIIGSITPNDIGNNTTSSIGINFTNIRNSEISKCIIRNVTTTGTGLAQGISVDNGGASGSYGNVNVFNNTIYNINRTDTTSTSITHVHGIRVELAATATARVYNNLIFNITSTGNTAIANVHQAVRGISYGTTTGLGTAYVYHNSVQINNPSVNRSSSSFWKGGNGTAVLQNNIFSNISPAQAGVAKHYVIYRSAGTITSSNNLLWTEHTNGLVGYYTTDQSTLQAWKTATTGETNSLFYRPAFMSATDLGPNAADTAAWAINGRAMHQQDVGFDINGNQRAGTFLTGTPDIGAYEFTPVSLAPQAIPVPATATAGSTQTFFFAEDTVAKITWNVGSVVPSTIAVRVYSGETPSPYTLSGQELINSYYTIDMPAGTYNYSAQVYYKNIWKGSIQNALNLFPAKTLANGNWTIDLAGSTDTVNYTLTSGVLNQDSVVITGASQYGPLPVKLVVFTAVKSKDGVKLLWKTASEINNKGFEIQRSADGKTFDRIHFENGRGNSHSTTAYDYMDINAFSAGNNVVYYRLMQVDANGTVSYSKVVKVLNDEKAGNSISAYPNPFTNQINIEVLSGDGGSLELTVMDLTGKTVDSKHNIHVNQGTTILQIGSDHLEKGIYFVSVSVNGIRQVMKVIKD